MYRHLFRNRWIALAFVLLMAASAVSLVGTESGGGMIGEATAEFHDQKAEFQRQAEALSKPTRSHTVVDLSEVDGGEAEDEESLIDPGTGIEPEPDPGAGFEPEPDLDPTPVIEP